ncbi:hypothetical protein G9U52_30750 [Paenibacillus sp. S3N08]|uniref:Uncharacterized protein n=2 Tax=Paenibacillus agricola TaxID=2716264 RepID=A0ABX0JDH8_9BACL|nr:hypothetical protein [Paenibacillus agricola]
MDSGEISKLERKFDKDLTEGEATEIKNVEVIHTDDEELYEERDDEVPTIPAAAFVSRSNGTMS